MVILVSNDDGVHSTGITSLAAGLRVLGDVYVVAPDRERSAAGHSLTLHRPLLVERLKERVFSVNGTPTDCVNLAVNGLLPKKPDLVISGINKGGNLGDDITYSGTVSAAMEGLLLGVPSFAVSLVARSNFKFGAAAAVAVEIARDLIARKLPKDTLLNVNVPNLPLSRIRGVSVTHQGKRIFSKDDIVEIKDPRGRTHYWVGGGDLGWEDRRGSDFEAISRGRVSVTPIHLDLTNYTTMGRLRSMGRRIGRSLKP